MIEPVPVCDDVGARILSLPITDAMREADVDRVCGALVEACNRTGLNHVRPERRGNHVHSALIVGGGPAGTALLTAATKQDRLIGLARDGLAVVERDAVLGRGEIGGYAITSDSTAETFLTAVKDNVHADVAALTEHLSGQEIALHKGGTIGVPLSRTTPFLEATGARLAAIVAGNGGVVATRSEVVEARRTRDGAWAARVRNLVTGDERVMRAANLVIATGGYQAREHVAAERVAGATLGELAGERLMLGDDFLRLGGLDRLRERIAATRAPRIADRRRVDQRDGGGGADPQGHAPRCRWERARSRSITVGRSGPSIPRSRRRMTTASPISAPTTSAQSAASSIASPDSGSRRANWCSGCSASAGASPIRAWRCDRPRRSTKP